MPRSDKPPLAQAGLPASVRAARDVAEAARQVLPAPTFAYLAGGAGRDAAMQANARAFDRWHILPRVLRDVRHGHSRSRLGHQALEHPVVLAPVALQLLVHPGAERETARAAEATDTLMVLSAGASTRLEALTMPQGRPHWFQMLFLPERAHTLALLRRAEDAGYGAIVITLDAQLQAPSQQALRAGFRLPPELRAVNLPDPPPAAAPSPGECRIFQGLMRQAPTLDDLCWLIGQTRLPVWAKGVMHPDDALMLQAAGAAGIVVSNHGGRALNAAPASLSLLPELRRAVGPDWPLLFDGGIASGEDLFKSLALGADACGIGRLQLWALAAGGALGVAQMLRLLREELALTMALAGCATLADIGPHCLRPG